MVTLSSKGGQSMTEFVLILAVLTILGMYLASRMSPGPNGTISNAQDKATVNIAKD
jgi:hypothetical protein